MLKKMKYPEYFRLRIITTLWNFGFCAGSFLYCFATLSRNNVQVINFQSNILSLDTDVVPGKYVFGFLILSTYYAQYLIWELIQTGNFCNALEQFIFVLLAIFTYLNKCVEIFFILVYLTNISACILELSRTFSFQIYNKYFMNFISITYLIIHVIIGECISVIVIPFYIFIPIGKHLVTKLTTESLMLNTTIWIWLLINIYNSVFIKLLKHYLLHLNTKGNVCEKEYLECSIFMPRSDTVFNLKQVRRQIEERKQIELPRKKRTASSSLYQTWKCMLTIRRRIKTKRLASKESIVKGILNEIVNEVVKEEVDGSSD